MPGGRISFRSYLERDVPMLRRAAPAIDDYRPLVTMLATAGTLLNNARLAQVAREHRTHN